MPCRHTGDSRGTIQTILDLSSTPGKNHSTFQSGRWASPRAGQDVLERENPLVPLRNRTPDRLVNTRVGTLIVVTIYLQLIQNRYMFRSFTVLHCSHQHCVQPVASDVEVVGYL